MKNMRSNLFWVTHHNREIILNTKWIQAHIEEQIAEINALAMFLKKKGKIKND